MDTANNNEPAPVMDEAPGKQAATDPSSEIGALSPEQFEHIVEVMTQNIANDDTRREKLAYISRTIGVLLTNENTWKAGEPAVFDVVVALNSLCLFMIESVCARQAGINDPALMPASITGRVSDRAFILFSLANRLYEMHAEAREAERQAFETLPAASEAVN